LLLIEIGRGCGYGVMGCGDDVMMQWCDVVLWWWCRAFIVSLSTEETLRVFKLSKKEDGGSNMAQVAFDFPKVSPPHNLL